MSSYGALAAELDHLLGKLHEEHVRELASVQDEALRSLSREGRPATEEVEKLLHCDSLLTIESGLPLPGPIGALRSIDQILGPTTSNAGNERPKRETAFADVAVPGTVQTTPNSVQDLAAWQAPDAPAAPASPPPTPGQRAKQQLSPQATARQRAQQDEFQEVIEVTSSDDAPEKPKPRVTINDRSVATPPPKSGSPKLGSKAPWKKAGGMVLLQSKLRNKDTFYPRLSWDVTEDVLDRVTKGAAAFGGSCSGLIGFSTDSTIDLPYGGDDDDVPWFMIHPRSNFRISWFMFGAVLLFFDAVHLPLYALRLEAGPFLILIGWLGTLYWTADVCVSMLTGTYIGTMLDMRFNTVARVYMRSWMLFDVPLCTVDWITLILSMIEASAGVKQVAQTMTASRAVKFFRAVRFLRLARMGRMLKDVKARLNSQVVLMGVKIGQLVGILIFMVHFLACLWYSIGEHPDGWVTAHGLQDRPLGDRYLYSYQYALLRLNPSAMESNLQLRRLPERFLAVLGSMGALVSLSLMISTITVTMNELKRLRHLRSRQMTLARDFASDHGITGELQARVKMYIETDHVMVVRRASEAELMELLPATLGTDLVHEAWSPIVTPHRFFKALYSGHNGAAREISRDALSEELVFLGDLVFGHGSRGENMYFVMSGMLSYITGPDTGLVNVPTRMSYATSGEHRMLAGFWLAEATLWTRWEHKGCLRAVRNGSILKVRADSFEKVLSEHKKAHALAATYAKLYVQELNGVDKEMLSDFKQVRKTHDNDEKWRFLDPTGQVTNGRATRSSGLAHQASMPNFFKRNVLGKSVNNFDRNADMS